MESSFKIDPFNLYYSFSYEVKRNNATNFTSRILQHICLEDKMDKGKLWDFVVEDFFALFGPHLLHRNRKGKLVSPPPIIPGNLAAPPHIDIDRNSLVLDKSGRNVIVRQIEAGCQVRDNSEFGEEQASKSVAMTSKLVATFREAETDVDRAFSTKEAHIRQPTILAFTKLGYRDLARADARARAKISNVEVRDEGPKFKDQPTHHRPKSRPTNRDIRLPTAVVSGEDRILYWNNWLRESREYCDKFRRFIPLPYQFDLQGCCSDDMYEWRLVEFGDKFLFGNIDMNDYIMKLKRSEGFRYASYTGCYRDGSIKWHMLMDWRPQHVDDISVPLSAILEVVVDAFYAYMFLRFRKSDRYCQPAYLALGKAILDWTKWNDTIWDKKTGITKLIDDNDKFISKRQRILRKSNNQL